MKIAFLCPYPIGVAPSQRFRFEQYIELLRTYNYEIVIEPYFSEDEWRNFGKPGAIVAKAGLTAFAFLRRLIVMFKLNSVQFIFIHRESTPLGPPIVEWFLTKVFGKKIIYDFDDAIWLTDKPGELPFIRALKWRSKVKHICKWSHKVSCGNAYLAAYAQCFNSGTIINPTTIDNALMRVPSHRIKAAGTNVTIGWTGSHSTLKYLRMLTEVLRLLIDKYPDLRLLIIADRDPQLGLKNSEFRDWNKDTEIEDLQAIDIGIMPLPDDEWTRGKCGFKALQYMALGIPAVISPVGVNKELLSHGVEGYLCSTSGEWFSNLEDLIINAEKRETMGQRGIEKVERRYSVHSNSANFLSLFQ